MTDESTDSGDDGLQPLVTDDIMAPWRKMAAEREAIMATPEGRAKQAEREARWEEDKQRQIRSDRARRLDESGPVDPDAAKAAVYAIGRCPRIEDHAGSVLAAESVEFFLSERKIRTLVLLGGAGRGKSWAATWAIAESGGMFLPATSIRPHESWNQRVVEATEARLLVFDELGGEQPSEWHAHEAATAIESRHNAGRKTIVTSNVPLRIEDVPDKVRDRWAGKTLADRYGDRFISRLSDVRTALVVKCGGDDLRRKP